MFNSSRALLFPPVSIISEPEFSPLIPFVNANEFMRDGVLSFEGRALRYINGEVYFAVDGSAARKLFSDVFSKFRSWSCLLTIRVNGRGSRCDAGKDPDCSRTSSYK